MPYSAAHPSAYHDGHSTTHPSTTGTKNTSCGFRVTRYGPLWINPFTCNPNARRNPNQSIVPNAATNPIAMQALPAVLSGSLTGTSRDQGDTHWGGL